MIDEVIRGAAEIVGGGGDQTEVDNHRLQRQAREALARVEHAEAEQEKLLEHAAEARRQREMSASQGGDAPVAERRPNE